MKMFFFFFLFHFYILNFSKNSVTEENYNNYSNQNDIFTSKKKTNINDTNFERKLEENSNNEDNYQPIRLFIHKGYMDYQDVNKDDVNYFNAIYDSIDRAGDILRKIIKVIPLNYSITLDEAKLISAGYNIESLKTSLNNENSFNYDLVILIRIYRPGDYDKLEYGIPEILMQNGEDGRPIVGSIIYNYDFMKSDERDKLSKEQLVNLLTYAFLHEFTHILGFMGTILSSKGLLSTQTVERISGYPFNKTVFIGPKVREIASSYFGCNLGEGEGIEMDNYAKPENLYNSHWEVRILLGDYMISEIYYPEQVISEITLALLEDLGWYKINYYTGGLMRFGKNKGCDFLTKDCIKINNENTDVISSFPNEFCSPDSFSTCSSGRLSRGYCYDEEEDRPTDLILNRTWIYGISKYIDNFYNMHGYKLVEYCPISFETETNNENYYLGSCYIGNESFGDQILFNRRTAYNYSQFGNAFMEKFGNSSFCALSSLLKKNDNDQRYYDFIRPTCYQMFCSGKSLTIRMNDEYIVCPNEGGIIHIDGNETNYKGYLMCPDYYLICSGKEYCNNMFDCAEKESLYKPFNLTSNNPEKVYSEVTQNKKKGASLNGSNISIGWELDVDGKCPMYCRQCIDNKQCIICNDSHIHYVGTSENDLNPIYCYESNPGEGYYITNDYRQGKNYYFKCIENCIACKKENKNKCFQCDPIHFLDEFNMTCEEERIPGCKDYDNISFFLDQKNNNGKAYDKCYNCNNDAGYYCLNNNHSKCVYLSNYTNETYYNMENKEYPCVQKCDLKYIDCEKCNNVTCTKCKYDNTFINKNHNCVKNITHCKVQNELKDVSECLTCDDGFHCLRNDTSNCQIIININEFYYSYNYTENNIRCYERCNNTFQNCVKCTEKGCLICESGFFVYNGKCIKNITGCIDHFYNGTLKECNKCNEEEGFYCLNNSKSECYDISLDSYLPYYYKSTKNDFSCYITCDNLLDNCLTCDGSKCTNCTSRYIINDAGNFCLVRPFIVPDDDKCTFNASTPIDETIFEIDPWDFNDKYWENNIPYISVVDHYIGNNFTVTVFINSECTEALLPAGYFKINVSELQQTMIEESHTEGMKLLFSVYINYNHKGHLLFYNISSWYLDPYKLCNSCLDVDYYLTNNKLNVTLNDTFGMAIMYLIYYENVDIIDKDFDIYNDICKNVTLCGIDIPLKRRLHYLYLHSYRDVMLCYSDNCTVDEYHYENSIVVCKCRMGNKLEDVIYSEKFEYKPYDDKEELKNSNEFIDSLSTIKCTINGFNSKNFKSNIGLFICIAFIVIQIGLSIFYFLKSKPIVNANRPINMSNPPKKKENIFLKFITDWTKPIHNGKIGDEEEIFVQPRDEAEDQLLEEERSFAGENILDISGLSIDTNVGGAIKGVSTGNKIREKVDQKKVLILLSNKGKKKSKTYVEDMKSDSDIIPQPEDQDENNIVGTLSYGKIYWQVLSLKQHIINFFSPILCFKITESFIPLPIRLIRSLFMIILSFILNILFLNQEYYDSKFSYFDKEYTIINSETGDIFIPNGKKIAYAVKHTFVKALISLVILLVVQFLFGIIFFSVRKSLIKARAKKSHKAIQEISAIAKVKNIVFFVLVMVCMILFFFTLSGFIAIYGGGVVDYLTAGIISLILLEIIPFLWSLIIALFKYFGIKNNNKCLFKISQFFMF